MNALRLLSCVLPLLVLLLAVATVSAREPMRTIWLDEGQTWIWEFPEPMFALPAADGSLFIASTHQHGFFLNGGYGSHMDSFVRKMSPAGEILWTQRHVLPEHRHDDRIYDAALTPDGGLAACGTFDWKIGLLKVSAGGELLWTRHLTGTRNWGNGFGVAVDREGAVLVCGRSSRWFSPYDTRDEAVIAKYAPGGDLLWTVRSLGIYGRGSTASEVHVGPDDSPYVITAENINMAGLDTQSYVGLSKYSPEGGMVWQRVREVAAGLREYYSASLITKAGDIFVRGYILRPPFTYVSSWIQKYSADGELLWEDEWANFSPNSGVIALDEERGFLYMVGTLNGISRTLVQVDAQTGQWLWWTDVEQPPGPMKSTFGLQIDRHGNIFVEGRLTEFRNRYPYRPHFTVSKFTPEGRQLWTYWHPNAWLRGPGAMALGSDGDVYVVGQEAGRFRPLPERCEGDLDYSGVVDDADLAEVILNYGDLTFAGDVDEDGVVAWKDLMIVLDHYGMGE